MTDTTDNTAQPNWLDRFTSFFKAGDMNDPRVNQALRQRIALEMMQQSGRGKGYPKNVGEGLTAIGDALGERGMMNQLLQADAANRASNTATVQQGPPVFPAVPGPQASATLPPSVANANAMMPPDTGGDQSPPPSSDQPMAATVPRDTIASLLAQRPSGGPQANPTPAPETAPGSIPQPSLGGNGSSTTAAAPATTGGPAPVPDQRLAQAAPVIQPAPAAPPQIRTAPPPQQGDVPAPEFGMVPPAAKQPVAPQATPPLPYEVWANKLIAQKPWDDDLKAQLAPGLAAAANQRTYQDQRNKEKYDKDYADYLAQNQKRQDAIVNQAKNKVEGQQAQQTLLKSQLDNELRTTFGGLPTDDVIGPIKTNQANAQAAAKGILATGEAMDAFRKGMFTGQGADWKLEMAKWLRTAGYEDKGNTIANTETFRAAIKPVAAAMAHALTPRLTERELGFAQQMAGGDIQLDAKTFPQIMDILNRGSVNIIREHNDRIDKMFGSNPRLLDMARGAYGVEMPPISFSDEASVDRMDLPNGTRVIVNGRPGVVRK